MDETNDKFLEYKESVQTQAEDLVLKQFPKKVIELNELLKSKICDHKDLTEIYQTLNIPAPDSVTPNSHAEQAAEKCKGFDRPNIATIPSGMVPCNKHVYELVQLVRPYLRQQTEDAELLRMWITFLTPKIEDGNNFGVSVQKDILTDILAIENDAAKLYTEMSSYFTSRGFYIKRLTKYPHIEDYRRAIEEMDKEEHQKMLFLLSDLRNRYAKMYDIITKNLEKIRMPRSSNTSSLY